MNKLFSDFPKVSKTEWEEKLKKELKGADFTSSLVRKDEIEELEFSTYTHSSDKLKSNEIPGQVPFTRGNKTQNNDWNIAASVFVDDEKLSNSKALDLLMTGCTSLIFELKKEQIDLDLLFDQIGFEFIQVQFSVSSFNQYSALLNYFKTSQATDIVYRLDFIHSDLKNQNFLDYCSISKKHSSRFCLVDGYSLQQCGATISQEISFALATGHEYLVKLMNAGYTIDEAASRIHFSLGIGANYFYEIVKIRAFRKLWFKVVTAYSPIDSVSCKACITSETGFINKSLKDPYTNLLRQTTEAMAVITAGVETVLVRPYDGMSTEGISELSSRMAMNISLVLKDESYFDKVIDPLGGSYSIESLTEQIATNSWSQFQEIENKGGVTTDLAIEFVQSNVRIKSQLKLENIKSGKQMLIGVNKYPNPLAETNSWLPSSSFIGLDHLIFERDI